MKQKHETLKQQVRRELAIARKANERILRGECNFPAPAIWVPAEEEGAKIALLQTLYNIVRQAD